MSSESNLIQKIRLAAEYKEDEVSDWRLLGQEPSGILVSWTINEKTTIGSYQLEKNQFNKIFTLPYKINCIQGTFHNNYIALIVFNGKYSITLIQLFGSCVIDFGISRENQMRLQFVNIVRKTTKLLILIHKEGVILSEIVNGKDLWREKIVKEFLWAQWDPLQQTLYFIREKRQVSSFPDEECEAKVTPTFSCLQFHDNIVHENILNIPLNIPKYIESCSVYEDDVIPLRVHDSSLDLLLLSHSSGAIYMCHHYLYQPIQTKKEIEDEELVHIAYTITVFHHSCILQGTIPSVPYKKAKMLRPLFTILGNHIMVYVPDICVQLLDVGIMHEPCCHMTLHPFSINIEPEQLFLATLYDTKNIINLITLDTIEMKITDQLLIKTFKSTTSLENKVSILHYLLIHCDNMDLALELILWQMKEQQLHCNKLLREFLLGGSFMLTSKTLPEETKNMSNLLPLTTQHTGAELEVKITNYNVVLTQDVLWNASMMILSPQQRIYPYQRDFWIIVWENLIRKIKGSQRFRPNQVVDKLNLSLQCYQETLACATPQTPNDELVQRQLRRKSFVEELPFNETETGPTNRQEHIISVNERELNLYLLQETEKNKCQFEWLKNSQQVNVYSVANKYVSSQLEISRKLCQFLCNIVLSRIDKRYRSEKGYSFIANLDEESRLMLFTFLERYYNVVEVLGFPYPQGFISFFTLLGYETLDFDIFLQYVDKNIFDLQKDVLKILIRDFNEERISSKHRLKTLNLLSRARAKRVLAEWPDPVSLMIRAREHSSDVLSGVGSTQQRHCRQQKKPLPTNNFFALDTFLDLLTAKENLTNLDFEVLIESIEETV